MQKSRSVNHGSVKINLNKLLKEEKFLGNTTFFLKQLLKNQNFLFDQNYQPTRIRSFSSTKKKNLMTKKSSDLYNNKTSQTPEDNNDENETKSPDPKSIVRYLFNLLTNNEESFYNTVQKFNYIKDENDKFLKDFYTLKSEFNKKIYNYKKQNNIISEVLGGNKINSVYKANPLLFQTYKDFYYFYLSQPNQNKIKLDENKAFQYVLKILKLINYKKYEEFETNKDENKINEIRKFHYTKENEEIIKQQQSSINKLQNLIEQMKKQKNFLDIDSFPIVRKTKPLKSYKNTKKANTSRINPYKIPSNKTHNNIIKNSFNKNKKLKSDSLTISQSSIKTSRTNIPSVGENIENISKEYKKNFFLNKSNFSNNNSLSSFNNNKKKIDRNYFLSNNALKNNSNDPQKKFVNSKNFIFSNYVNNINMLKRKETLDSLRKSTIDSCDLFRKKSNVKEKEKEIEENSLVSLIKDIKIKNNSYNIFKNSRPILPSNLNPYRNQRFKLYTDTNRTISNLDKEYLKTIINFQIMSNND